MQITETLREWTESAPYWEKYSSTIRTIFAPITRALIADAEISKGQSVLDVAGGPGEPSLSIAEAVGPSGSVMCTDAVEEMVEAAKREALRRGITNIRFRQCLADALPFADNSFDCVVSRLGVMFFPDPVAALREMLRVTKAGGALALAVWQESENNPFLHVITEVMSRHMESSPVDPDSPGAFRFAKTGKLANILKSVGAIDVRERLLKFQIEAPISVDEFWELRTATSPTLREKLARLSQEQANQVAQEVKQTAGGFFSNGEMSFPARIIIVTGHRS
jgi:ubiquinone/menaquinone biosynthesis C-methylase UbiE